MSLDWKDSYKVDHAEIDAQHQILFSRANDFLCAKDKAALTATSMELFKYACEHLAYEEELMNKWQYVEAPDHIAQHNDLISLLDEVVQSLPSGDVNTDDLEAFLSHWLLGHITTSDQKLAVYLKFSDDQSNQCVGPDFD